MNLNDHVTAWRRGCERKMHGYSEGIDRERLARSLTVLLSDDIVIVNRIQLGDVPGFAALTLVYR